MTSGLEPPRPAPAPLILRMPARVLPRGGLIGAAAFGIAICGTVAFALGMPRLIGAMVWMRADPLLAVAERGEAPPPEALKALVESPHAAALWHGESRAWLAIGMARLEEARTTALDTARRRRLLDGAVFALDRGLALAPENGAAWMRFGEALILRAGPSPRAAHALAMSLKTAPVAPELAVERLALLFAMWELFDAVYQARIAWQIEMAGRDPDTADALAALMDSADGRRVAAAIRAERDAPAR